MIQNLWIPFYYNKDDLPSIATKFWRRIMAATNKSWMLLML